jgi:hypothetical protein
MHESMAFAQTAARREGQMGTERERSSTRRQAIQGCDVTARSTLSTDTDPACV